MNVIYPGESMHMDNRPSIFLESNDEVWLDLARRHLRKRGFDGHVFVPLAANGTWAHQDPELYDDWYLPSLESATVVVFWMPGYEQRTIWNDASMFALSMVQATTPWRFLLGLPDLRESSPIFRQFKAVLASQPNNVHSTMEALLDAAIKVVQK